MATSIRASIASNAPRLAPLWCWQHEKLEPAPTACMTVIEERPCECKLAGIYCYRCAHLPDHVVCQQPGRTLVRLRDEPTWLSDSGYGDVFLLCPTCLSPSANKVEIVAELEYDARLPK